MPKAWDIFAPPVIHSNWMAAYGRWQWHHIPRGHWRARQRSSMAECVSLTFAFENALKWCITCFCKTPILFFLERFHKKFLIYLFVCLFVSFFSCTLSLNLTPWTCSKTHRFRSKIQFRRKILFFTGQIFFRQENSRQRPLEESIYIAPMGGGLRSILA